MADSTVLLFFAGLIAFVPGADNWTAYLVEGRHSGCDHTSTLAVIGNASISASGGFCSQVGGGIRCRLSDTDIVLPKLKGNRLIPGSEPAGPLPTNQSEGASLKWLIKVAKVEPDAATAKNFGDGLERFVGGRTSFNWDSARTCHLEESEIGRISAFRFVDGGFSTRHTQALAESVLFTAKVDNATPVIIELKDRVTGGQAKILLDCASGTCPIIRVENNADPACNPDMLHFKVYYNISKMSRHKPEPKAFGETVGESMVSDRCERILGEALERHLRIEDSKGFVNWHSRQLIQDIVRTWRPEDRIICPPTLFAQ